jgi:Outer membrane protein beta-barrel domain
LPFALTDGCIQAAKESTMRKFGAPLLFVFLAIQIATAQRNELAVTIGGKFTVNQNFDINPSFAIEGSYAGRLIHVPLAALYFELPVAAGLESTSSSPPCGACVNVVRSFKTSALFVAPGLKLKLGPELPVSPYFTVGGGLARFRAAASDGTETTNNTNTLQFGAGMDFKVLPFVSFRGEVRDFYSGTPFTPIAGPGTRQHNLFTTAGIVLRF